MNLDQLQRSWTRLLGRFGVSPAAMYPSFDSIVARYRQPHRFYHNLEHIAEVLNVVGQLADFAENLDSIELAVWYHDAIYDPKGKDNEEQSSELAIANLASLGVSHESVNRVAALIRATAHTDGSAPNIDTAILLDADLAILGAETSRYRRYADGIRQEYAWVDDAAYRAGRTRILESFLKRERIYRTERMFALGEQAARANLRAELARLAI